MENSVDLIQDALRRIFSCIPAEAAVIREVRMLTEKLEKIDQSLEKQMATLVQQIGERRQNVPYSASIHILETSHTDNMKVLRSLIYAEEDQPPLFDGTYKRRTSLNVLRRKHVLLLISDLDMSLDELSILEQIYMDAKHLHNRPESQYEVVWLPVVDTTASSPWNDAKQKKFEFYQNSMPWYSVVHPKMLDPAVIRFIKEVWGFTKKPQVVVLDPQGKELNRNAMHMMWIWGSTAFPFTKSREQALWREETWRMDLIVDGIDPTLLEWMAENRYICLYGGEDIEWIRKFTVTTRAVANEAGIPLEMLYVGKSNPKERVRRNNGIIQVEKLSHTWQDLTLIWFLWVRLESMFYSKVQHGTTVENDPIMHEVMTMLSFDGSDRGWAVFSRGDSPEMAKGRDDELLACLSQFDRWKDDAKEEGFVIALKKQVQLQEPHHHHNRLILPASTTGERVVCAECGMVL